MCLIKCLGGLWRTSVDTRIDPLKAETGVRFPVGPPPTNVRIEFACEFSRWGNSADLSAKSGAIELSFCSCLISFIPSSASFFRFAARVYDWLHTLEGILWHTPLSEANTVRAYALTHRIGRIDAAWTFGGNRQLREGQSERLAWAKSFEDGAGEMANHGVGRLKSYGIEGPWVIMTSVLRTKGTRLVLPNSEQSRPAWRDAARLPELILENVTPESLLPIYRAFWLLFGVPRPT